MKRQNNFNQTVIILLIMIMAIVIIPVVWKLFVQEQETFPTEDPATEAPATESPVPPTEEPDLIEAVVKESVICYFGDNLGYQINVYPLVIIGILERNGVGDLVRVKLNEKVDCWLPLSSLELNNHSLDTVPIAMVSPIIPTSTAIPTPTPLPVDMTPTPPERLIMRWKISSYDCDDGKATGATIDLIVSGGVPEYNFSPKLPIYAKPGQSISITVRSKTNDGDPSGIISFKVPDATDRSEFECEKPGNVPIVKLPPTDSPPPTDPPATEPPATEPPDSGDPPATDPPPTEEPVCYNPQGHVIPCKGNN